MLSMISPSASASPTSSSSSTSSLSTSHPTPSPTSRFTTRVPKHGPIWSTYRTTCWAVEKPLHDELAKSVSICFQSLLSLLKVRCNVRVVVVFIIKHLLPAVDSPPVPLASHTQLLAENWVEIATLNAYDEVM